MPSDDRLRRNRAKKRFRFVGDFYSKYVIVICRVRNNCDRDTVPSQGSTASDSAANVLPPATDPHPSADGQ